MKQTLQQRIHNLLSNIWLFIIIAIIIFLTGRYFMVKAFITPQQITDYASDIKRMWMTGFHFDYQIAAALSLPICAWGLISIFSNKTWNLLKGAIPYYIGFIILVLSLVACCNFYYFRTYNNMIDTFAFGIVDGNTKSVLYSIWNDYPILRCFLVALVLAVLAAYLSKRILKKPFHFKKWNGIVFVLYLALQVYVIANMCRGSFGEYAFHKENSQVSNLVALNKITANGAIATEWAWKDHKRDFSFHKVSLKKGEELMQNCGYASLQDTTPTNAWLEQNKPNVVMVLMESFGGDMLVYDHMPNNDLLGNFRKHFESDFVFKRFMSTKNSTIDTYSMLFFQSPVIDIAQSSAQNTKLKDNPFRKYKDAGYKTVFIYGGSANWRNLSNFLLQEGVDEVYDQHDMMMMFPESEALEGPWGVPDQYTFALAKKVLDEATVPTFIQILTISNHTPYPLPPDVKLNPIEMAPELDAKIISPAHDGVLMLRTYQYANNCCGKFISDIKASPKGNNTIIAATGDHHTRRIKPVFPDEIALDHSVPFYLYIPQTILDHCSWKYDSLRIGSHKDIVPTLYSYSLSNTEYLTLGGRNMLAPQDDSTRNFGYNEWVYMDQQGAYPISDSLSLYAWCDSTHLRTLPQALPVPEKLQLKIKSLKDLLYWSINYRVKGAE